MRREILFIITITFFLTAPVISEQISLSNSNHFFDVSVTHDFEVNDDGGDVDATNIQSAIDMAEDGDIIWVYSGSYNPIRIKGKSVKVIGKSFEKNKPNKITSKPVIWAADTYEAVYIQGENITFSNFKIKYCERTPVYLWKAINCEVSGLTIIEDIVDNPYSRFSCGICLKSSDGNIITGNSISGSTYTAMMLSESNNNNITANNMYKNQYGIELISWSDNNTIMCNYFSDNHKLDMRIYTADSNAIKYNTFYDGGGIIIVVDSYENTVIGNIFEHSGRMEISIRSERNRIIGNIIKGGSINSINLDRASSNEISYNEIYSNSGSLGSDKHGIHLEDSSYNNEIYENNIYGKKYGIKIGKNCNFNHIYMNNFFNNSINAFDDSQNIWFSQSKQKGNYWGDYQDVVQNPIDQDNDGIWDKKYPIQGDGSNDDHFPLLDAVAASSPSKPYIHSMSGHFCRKGKTVEFRFRSTDDDGSDVRYIVLWGDFSFTLTDFYDSGFFSDVVSHQWNLKANFNMWVKAVDEHGKTSEWSDEWVMSVSKEKSRSPQDQPIFEIFTKIIERFDWINHFSSSHGILNWINSEKGL